MLPGSAVSPVTVAAVGAHSDITLVYVLGLWSYGAVEQLRDAFVRSEERFNERRAKVNSVQIFLRGTCAECLAAASSLCTAVCLFKAPSQ